MTSVDATLSCPLFRLPAAERTERPRPAPQPLGLRATFGWMTAAIAGPFLLAMLAVCVLAGWRAVHPGFEQAQIEVNGGSLLLVGMIVLACRRAGWNAADYLAVTRPHGRYVLLGAVALVVPLGVLIGLGLLGLSLAADQDAPTTIASLILMLISTVVVAPIWEELIFRGFLYRGLAASHLGVGGAIVLTSMLWALIHLDRTWLGFGEVFFCGLVWGWLRWRTGSTAVTMIVHALNNSVAGLALTGAALGWWAM